MNTKIQNATIAALKNKVSIKFIDCDKNTETLQNLENNYHIIILFWFRNKLFQRDFSCFSFSVSLVTYHSANLRILNKRKQVSYHLREVEYKSVLRKQIEIMRPTSQRVAAMFGKFRS